MKLEARMHSLKFSAKILKSVKSRNIRFNTTPPNIDNCYDSFARLDDIF